MMMLRNFLLLILPVTLLLSFSGTKVSHANPNTGPPTNLHRRFVVSQVKRKAAQGRPVKKNVGVWISGGYERTVANARRSGYRKYRTRRFRRW